MAALPLESLSKPFRQNNLTLDPRQRTAVAAGTVQVILPRPLKAQLAVRAEAHELKNFGIRFPVDEYQIRLDVTVPMILPVACQWVVPQV